MKNILVLSFFPAFSPPATGGEARLYYFYKGLSRFYHITLLSSSHPGDKEEVFYHGNSFVERRIPKDQYFMRQWQKLEGFSSGGDLSAICTAACGQYFTKLHQAYLEEYEKAQIIIHDFPFMVDYDLFFQVDNKIRIYNAHNCESELYQSLHPAPKSKPLWDIVANAEKTILQGCDAVLYCNEGDLADFKKIGLKEGSRAIRVPNGAIVRQQQAHRKAGSELANIVFMGSAHPPNTEAALYITTQIAPALPQIQFHIVGECLPAGKYPKNVIRHGFVEEKKRQEILLAADLAINPIMSGSGSSVKVFDFLSFSIPLLTTQFGARGVALEDEKNAIISNRENFIECIRHYQQNLDSLNEIAANGYRLLTEKYSWDVISAAAVGAIDKIKRHNPFPEGFFLVLNDYDSFRDVGGGGVRTQALYEAAKAIRPVVFISFSSDEKISARNENGILIYNIPKEKEHVARENELNDQFYISVNDILASRYCCHNDALTSIYNVLKKNSVLIIAEHVYMTALPLHYCDRFVYSSHNNESEIKQAALQYHPRRDELVTAVRRLESRAVARAAAVISVSQHDAEAFMRASHAAAPVFVIENGAATPQPPAPHSADKALSKIDKKRAAVFVGSAHAPNVEAVQYITEVLAPYFGDCQFHIVGSAGEGFVGRVPANVILWGTLAEAMKSAVMQACSVALNPVVSGGGSNIKVADYFANGLHVVSTKFGFRGYDELLAQGFTGVEIADFPTALTTAFAAAAAAGAEGEARRRRIFQRSFAMTAKAAVFADFLRGIMAPKKRVLFVSYRYTSPEQGGAELYFSHLLKALDDSDRFQLDVVAPAVSEIKNRDRFAEQYRFERGKGARIGFKNTRFMRFALDEDDADSNAALLARAWRAQPAFEKSLYSQMRPALDATALAWGWSELDRGGRPFRWALSACGLHLQGAAQVQLECHAPGPIALEVRDERGRLLADGKMQGDFSLSFFAEAGWVEISASIAKNAADPRPLAFMLFALRCDDVALDLATTVFALLPHMGYERFFDSLDAARVETRDAFGVRLTEIRGPFSRALEHYIETHVADYDLVVTHNNVFRPAVFAVGAARAAAVPVISVPHVHLDDDYYHFADVHDSIVQSDCALISPRAAADFYARKGANAIYHAPGADLTQGDEAEDIAAFRQIFTRKQPFVLVLGRKSAAKGYALAVRAVERLAASRDLHLVLIGSDEDGVALDAPHVSFLGVQPDAVVRGALRECLALVNMSASESFGIVLLEAWRAGRPVIVNQNCAAFHDLAVDGENAFLVVDEAALAAAITALLDDPDLAGRLAANGQRLLAEHSWQRSEERFLQCVEQLLAARAADA